MGSGPGSGDTEAVSVTVWWERPGRSYQKSSILARVDIQRIWARCNVLYIHFDLVNLKIFFGNQTLLGLVRYMSKYKFIVLIFSQIDT